MKIVVKNSSMVFQTKQAYPVQTETLTSLNTAGTNNKWVALTTQVNNGETYKVKVEGETTWSGNLIIGFSDNNVYAGSPDRALISENSETRDGTINVSATFGYIYVYVNSPSANSITISVQRLT